jgi:hypothetical protein
MLASSLPPVTALPSHDRGQLPTEVRLARVRAEVAVVRTLADHIELLVGRRQVDGLSEQLIEEMGRLGHLLFETAADLTRNS